MSAEQVAGILRQCSQHVRLVVARSVREPNTTTTTTTTTGSTIDTPALMSQHISMSPEIAGKTTNNNSTSLATSPLPTTAANDGIITSTENKILLRTERLLGNNQNFEKILENLREQVNFLSSYRCSQTGRRRKTGKRLIIFEDE